MANILFTMIDINVGGTENVLLRFIDELNKRNHRITLLLANNEGGWINRIPTYVDVRFIQLTDKQKKNVCNLGIRQNIVAEFKHGRIVSAIKILIKKMLGDNLATLKFDFSELPCIDDYYDIAIAFQYHNTFTSRYVAEKINAGKKYIWVHNDLLTTKYNYKYTYSYIGNFDKIFCVSKSLKDEIDACYGNAIDVLNKVDVFYNSIDYEKIIRLANEPQTEISKDTMSILSVGRLNAQKGFDLAVKVAQKLKENNEKFCWYIIGEGEDQKKLGKLINKLKIEDCFKLLGKKENPFKYMRVCDIYVQPSRHEGYCTTTNEVKAFAKPVIVTDVAGMSEQFTNGIDGMIVKVDVNDIYCAIKSLLSNTELKHRLAKNVRMQVSNNEMIEEYFTI